LFSLPGILQVSLPQLGVRRKIDLDRLGMLWRQPAINPRLQIVLFYGPGHRPHFTLRSTEL